MGRIEEIRERLQKATPPPWHAYAESPREWLVDYPDLGEDDAGEADAEFTAHAREDIPYLLSHIDELEREIAEWRAFASEEAVKAIEEALRDG